MNTSKNSTSQKRNKQSKVTEYKKSFKRLSKDSDTLSISEEGMEDYLTQIKGY